MDASTLLGLVLGIGGIVFGNLLEGGQLASLVQGTAALIVLGGTVGAVMVAHGMGAVWSACKMLWWSMHAEGNAELKAIAEEIITASQTARRESMLALETRLNGFRSPYMRNVFRYMIDGIEPESLHRIFAGDIRISEERKLQITKVWSDAGGYAPTIGILGAILGLIHVMANLSDTAALGQGIAVAFVATIYGVGMANLVLLPIATRLKNTVLLESEIKEMIVEGAVGIASGMNPYIIEEKMRAYTDEGRA